MALACESKFDEELNASYNCVIRDENIRSKYF
jgi:hypothetical protein